MNTTIFVCILALVAVVCVSAYPAGPGERAGEALDNAARATGQAARDASKTIQRGAEKAGDRIGDAYDSTKNAVKDAGQDIKDAYNGATIAGGGDSVFKLVILAVSCFMVVKASVIFA